MAETNSSLGFDSKLQIVIVPKDKKYDTSTKNTHILVFREGENIIEVNGVKYQATSSDDLTAITNALINTGYLTKSSNGVLTTAENPGTVAALLGIKISTAASGDKKTVSAWINDILGQISGINADISNLQTLTNTQGGGAFVVRDTSGEGKTDFKNTTAIHTAINNAKNAAIDAAATDAANKDDQVKTYLIGNGKDSADVNSTPLKPGSGNTWAKSEAQQKNLSHLKDLLVDLQGQLDTLSGTNLKEVKDTIAAIEQELTDGSSGLITIIDGLKLFLGSGLNTGGASYTVNGTTYTKLQEIITALETEIKARIASVSKRSGETYIDVTTDSNKNVIVSSSEHLKTAVTNANSAIQSVNKNYNDSLISVSTSNKAVTVSSTSALQTAVTNANSAIQSVNTSEETLISVSTSNKAVTVSSTPALKTAVTNANAAFPKGKSSYTDAAALESGLKGNSSSDAKSETIAGAKKYADSKSDAAKTAAEATALLYANNVITWTVIS